MYALFIIIINCFTFLYSDIAIGAGYLNTSINNTDTAGLVLFIKVFSSNKFDLIIDSNFYYQSTSIISKPIPFMGIEFVGKYQKDNVLKTTDYDFEIFKYKILFGYTVLSSKDFKVYLSSGFELQNFILENKDIFDTSNLALKDGDVFYRIKFINNLLYSITWQAKTNTNIYIKNFIGVLEFFVKISLPINDYNIDMSMDSDIQKYSSQRIQPSIKFYSKCSSSFMKSFGVSFSTRNFRNLLTFGIDIIYDFTDVKKINGEEGILLYLPENCDDMESEIKNVLLDHLDKKLSINNLMLTVNICYGI